MDKTESLIEISKCIQQAEELTSSFLKTRVLKTMHKLYDLVNLHKPSGNFNELCVNEANKLLKGLDEEIKEQLKGGM